LLVVEIFTSSDMGEVSKPPAVLYRATKVYSVSLVSVLSCHVVPPSLLYSTVAPFAFASVSSVIVVLTVLFFVGAVCVPFTSVVDNVTISEAGEAL